MLPGLGPSCWAKDSDCSLVSNKNIIEILPSNSLGSGPGWPKSLPLMTSLTQNPNTPTKNFFSSSKYKTCQVFWAFDWVCSAYRTREILSKVTCDPTVFVVTAWINPGTKVLRGISSEVCWECAVRAWFHVAGCRDLLLWDVAVDMPCFFEQ